MNPLVAILEATDYTTIALIVLVCAGVASLATRQQVNFRRLERKLDVLLQHQGLEMPSRVSPEVQRLAVEEGSKIAAIKLHRKQNPELSLAEAKADIEACIKGDR